MSIIGLGKQQEKLLKEVQSEKEEFFSINWFLIKIVIFFEILLFIIGNSFPFPFLQTLSTILLICLLVLYLSFLSKKSKTLDYLLSILCVICLFIVIFIVIKEYRSTPKNLQNFFIEQADIYKDYVILLEQNPVEKSLDKDLYIRSDFKWTIIKISKNLYIDGYIKSQLFKLEQATTVFEINKIVDETIKAIDEIKIVENDTFKKIVTRDGVFYRQK